MMTMRIVLSLILAFFLVFTHSGGTAAYNSADGQAAVAMQADDHMMVAAQRHGLPAGKKCCDRMAGEHSAGVHCPADCALLVPCLIVLPADGTPHTPSAPGKTVASTQPKAPHRPPISV